MTKRHNPSREPHTLSQLQAMAVVGTGAGVGGSGKGRDVNPLRLIRYNSLRLKDPAVAVVAGQGSTHRGGLGANQEEASTACLRGKS
jgi:hypothetical protein